MKERVCVMTLALPMTDGPPPEHLRLLFERHAAEKMRADVERLGLEPRPETFRVTWRGLVGTARMVGIEWPSATGGTNG